LFGQVFATDWDQNGVSKESGIKTTKFKVNICSRFGQYFEKGKKLVDLNIQW
jgi:hypothetical protein